MKTKHIMCISQKEVFQIWYQYKQGKWIHFPRAVSDNGVFSYFLFDLHYLMTARCRSGLLLMAIYEVHAVISYIVYEKHLLDLPISQGHVDTYGIFESGLGWSTQEFGSRGNIHTTVYIVWMYGMYVCLRMPFEALPERGMLLNPPVVARERC